MDQDTDDCRDGLMHVKGLMSPAVPESDRSQTGDAGGPFHVVDE